MLSHSYILASLPESGCSNMCLWGTCKPGSWGWGVSASQRAGPDGRAPREITGSTVSLRSGVSAPSPTAQSWASVHCTGNKGRSLRLCPVWDEIGAEMVTPGLPSYFSATLADSVPHHTLLCLSCPLMSHLSDFISVSVRESLKHPLQASLGLRPFLFLSLGLPLSWILCGYPGAPEGFPYKVLCLLGMRAWTAHDFEFGGLANVRKFALQAFPSLLQRQRQTPGCIFKSLFSMQQG